MTFLFRGALAAPAFALAAFVAAGSASASPCMPDHVAAPSALSPDAPLTLDAALNEIRRTSPDIRAAGLEARALDADADQAGRWLNPTLSAELENFSGEGALSGIDQSETTFAVAQTFRLGNKRGLEERAARARAALGTAECAVILREAEREAALAYADLVAASEAARLADEAANLSSTLAETVSKRVEAGAAAPPELARARADAASLRAEAALARGEVEARAYALASLWGEADLRFAVPSEFQIIAAAQSDTAPHPNLAAAKAAVDAREAELKRARAEAIPDVTLSGGVRRFEATGDSAFIAGLSLPLPLFDRGSDTVRATRLRGDAAKVSAEAVEARLRAEQAAATATARAANTRLSILTEEALPEAEAAFEAADQGYAIGRFDLTTTLQARAALIDVRQATIAARRDARAADLLLRSLIGAAPFDGDTE
ncbi:MAG: TolC family protein [Hyphomonas sp.]|jgi:outer membrane protein, heavy metal efflux system|nr:TolC family protein [Hyphomonas sp.]MCB9971804.1 TolC family protein [Hyphomonas sp.]